MSKKIRFHWLMLDIGGSTIVGKSSGSINSTNQARVGNYSKVQYGMGISYLLSRKWKIQLLLKDHLTSLKDAKYNEYITAGLYVNYRL